MTTATSSAAPRGTATRKCSRKRWPTHSSGCGAATMRGGKAGRKSGTGSIVARSERSGTDSIVAKMGCEYRTCQRYRIRTGDYRVQFHVLGDVITVEKV